ncbi:MAG: Spy/CpxP family protein refolding chaperone [Pseudomonadota bacterium]
MTTTTLTHPSASNRTSTIAIAALMAGVLAACGGPSDVHDRAVAYPHTSSEDSAAMEFIEAAFGGASWHRFRGGPYRGDLTDAERNERVGRRMEELSNTLNATEAQRAQITKIALDLVASLPNTSAGGTSDAKDLRAAVLAEAVDPNAIEALRSARIAQADETSRLVYAAVVEIADVLTPEQRLMASQRVAEILEMRDPEPGDA